ncbi:MAG: TetR/AcrR family transcriptional regulator [Oscillospiraceae bacterium]|nr:TetR/AcrR family transcriptional regulator [Oscillospiraceae bacterium]
MKNTKEVKERIIKATTELIEESGGKTESITSRKIAERADVALGLINYHFSNKDNLISICTKRMLSGIIMCFLPDEDGIEVHTNKEQVAQRAKKVLDYIFRYPSVSSISTLEDLGDYTMRSNSVAIQKGFSLAIDKKAMDEDTKRLLVFMLTSSIQAAFLASGVSKDVLGYDMNVKEERDACAQRMIEILFDGVGNGSL